MQFLIDENVRSEVTDFLTREGYDVKVVPHGMKNSNVIDLAQKEKRVLLTHDRHFSNILMYPPHKYHGIIRIKIHPPSVDKTISALRQLLVDVQPEKFDKKLFVLEEDGFRQHS